MTSHLARGHRAGGRYRLDSELGSGPTGSVWRAVDETLDRPVALRFFDASLDRERLVERAALAASLNDPRVVRIYDTGSDGGRFYTVSELLPSSLEASMLPVPQHEVVRVGAQVAAALAYAHQRGVAHGALRPSNVLVGEQGVKVADFALTGEALGGAMVRTADDLVQLGGLLRFLSTGDDGRTQPVPLPDEPKGLARVIAGLESGSYRDARTAQRDLEALAPEPAPVRRNPWLPLLAILAAILLAVAAFAALRFGTSPGDDEPTSLGMTPYRIAAADDFDPLGDGREGSRTAGRGVDGNVDTFWSTERYASGADFSGRKNGVGVILDLGREEAVAGARVILAAPGCSYELRYSRDRSEDVDDWAVAATVTNAGRASTIELPEGVSSRWWLLWVTTLTKGVPGAGSAYACGIGEVTLYPPGA